MYTRILNWLPVALWFAFISFLSSLPGSTVSSIPWTILRFFGLLGPDSKDLLYMSNFGGHRIAHIIEYGIYGVLVIRAYSREKIKITIMTILLLACFIFLCGSLDEWHQTFVPGRTGQLIDAIFDTICGSLGMLIYKVLVLNKKEIL